MFSINPLSRKVKKGKKKCPGSGNPTAHSLRRGVLFKAKRRIRSSGFFTDCCFHARDQPLSEKAGTKELAGFPRLCVSVLRGRKGRCSPYPCRGEPPSEQGGQGAGGGEKTGASLPSPCGLKSSVLPSRSLPGSFPEMGRASGKVGDAAFLPEGKEESRYGPGKAFYL